MVLYEMDVSQDTDQWRALVDKVMKLNVKLNVEKCFPLKANPRQQKF
jgi:hypothetical protein